MSAVELTTSPKKIDVPATASLSTLEPWSEFKLTARLFLVVTSMDNEESFKEPTFEAKPETAVRGSSLTPSSTVALFLFEVAKISISVVVALSTLVSTPAIAFPSFEIASF